jgi:hypothetical protein
MNFARRPSRRPQLEWLEDRVVPALVINPTFAANIASDPSAAAIESTINQAIRIYEGYVANSITVNFTFEEMSGGLGANLTYYVPESYSSYLAALASHKSSAADASALASLPAGADNPVTGGTTINIRSPLARALGYADASNANIPMDSTISLNTSICNLTRPDADPSKFDLLAVTLHEMDEALGGGSGLDGLAQNAPAPATVEPLDLYRYASVAARSYNTKAPTGAVNQAYFSINGGVTDLVNFNQNAGGDFSDWYSFPNGAPTPPGPEVQDAYLTPGVVPNLGVELTRLDVLGFTIAAPAPTVSPNTSNLAANATLLIIQGTGFSSTAAGNIVKFSGGVTGTVARATPTQLTVAYLSGLSAGDLSATVTVGKQTSDPEQVATVVPVVTANRTTLAVNATTLIIHGFGFSSTAANNTVTFNGGATGTVTQATPTALTVTGLNGAPAGSLNVLVTSNGVRSSAYVQVAIVPITAPTLSTSSVSQTQITLSWTAVAGATSYQVQQWVAGVWKKVATLDGSTLSQNITVGPGSTNTFRVGATDAYATAWSNSLKVTALTLAPTVHSSTAAATQITLSWNALPGTTEYVIEEKLATGTYTILYVLNKSTTQFTFIAPAGGTNKFVVLAVGGVGTLKVNTQSAGVTLVTLSWNAVAGATAYEIDQQQPDGSWQKLATTTRGVTRKTLVEQPGNTYTFRVGAIDAAGAEFSDSVVVTA